MEGGARRKFMRPTIIGVDRRIMKGFPGITRRGWCGSVLGSLRLIRVVITTTTRQGGYRNPGKG